MSLALNVNNTIFAYPENRETDWGTEASAWAAAITTGVLQKVGGSFLLLAEVDFGPSFGLKSLYYKSRTASPATAGVLRLANTDVISFRNAGDNANLDLSVNSSNNLLFNGSLVGGYTFSDTSTINLTLTSADVTADVIAGSLTNTHINTSAAIARSKLASGTASRVLINDGTGAFSESGVTSTTLAFLDATSSVQTQLNTKLANVEEDTSPSLGGNLAGVTFNITGLTQLQATTVTGTTGQFGGAVSGQSGAFSDSLTVGGIPVATANPGGLNQQVQFNDGGVFAGDSQLLWDKTANELTTSRMVLSGDSSFESLPSLSFNGDRDTGIYPPGDGKIGFSSNGSKVLEISPTTTTGISFTSGGTMRAQTGNFNNLNIESLNFGWTTATTGTLVLEEAASYAYTINSLTGTTGKGTVSGTLKVNNIVVQGISATTWNTSQSIKTATSNNAVVANDRITFVVSGTSNGEAAGFTLKTTRG